MQLLILILKKTECMPKILSKFMAGGISGSTVVDCEGSLKLLDRNSDENPPIFGALRQFVNPDRGEGKLLLVVLKDSQVELAKSIINTAVGGIEKPDTGIMVTLPVLSAEGLAK